MTRVAYVDCVAGAAGDMLVGALLDAGADTDAVREGLAALGIEGLDLRFGRTRRGALDAARLEVVAPADRPHRGPGEIAALIEAARLPGRAGERALATFERLAAAEARVHGIPVEQVHFHEVGAVDAIADVCATALALESLGIERLVCSPLPLARGTVESSHGPIPLPAPATLALLEGAPVYGVEDDVELVTPTGAALVAALADAFGPPPAMRLGSVGCGAGARDLERVPNVVRVLVGQEEGKQGAAARPVSLLETNLDDMSPELVPQAAANATEAGALDVWTSPAGMKKARPGFVLAALARPENEDAVARALLRSTSTLGVRITRVERRELEREWRTVAVAGGEVRVKLGRLAGEVLNAAPEHEDCLRVASAADRPVTAVWAEALAAGQAWVGERDDG